MDLYLLNEINKLETNGGGGSSTGVGAFLPDYKDGTSPRGKHTWMAVSRHNSRGGQDNLTWTSSNGVTNHYVYFNGVSDYEFHFADALGKIGSDYVNSAEYTTQDGGGRPNIHFAKDNVLGYWGACHTAQSNTSYAPFRSMVVFVKNPTNSSITTTGYSYISSYWASGHDGSGIAVGTPNNTNKALVTSLSWTPVLNYSSSSTYHTNHNWSLTVPANTTVVVVMAASAHYWTGTTYQYFYASEETNLYNLHVWKSAGLECDLEMTLTALQFRDNYNSYANNAYRVWNATARNFPQE